MAKKKIEIVYIIPEESAELAAKLNQLTVSAYCMCRTKGFEDNNRLWLAYSDAAKSVLLDAGMTDEQFVDAMSDRGIDISAFMREHDMLYVTDYGFAARPLPVEKEV